MRYFGREVVASLFYEQLEAFIDAESSDYGPRKNYVPVPDRDDLETDYAFVHAGPVPVFLFAVKESNKARLAALSFLEYQRVPLLYRGYVVHEDFAYLPAKDRTRITSAATSNSRICLTSSPTPPGFSTSTLLDHRDSASL